jgi:hypothetical protein
MLCFIKILLKDRDTSEYTDNVDCPVARAINRRLKKDYHVSVAAHVFRICDKSGNTLLRDIPIPNWGNAVYVYMKADIIRKVEIPEKYLKRVHKKKVKVKTVEVDSTENERLDEIRKIVPVLNQLFPRWMDIDFTGCVMSQPYDCVATRIGRHHNIHCMPYTTVENEVIDATGRNCNLFTSWTSPQDWNQVAKEVRDEKYAAFYRVCKVLDKVFPNWQQVNLDDCDIKSLTDCVLMRIAKLNGRNVGYGNNQQSFSMLFDELRNNKVTEKELDVFRIESSVDDWKAVIRWYKPT